MSGRLDPCKADLIEEAKQRPKDSAFQPRQVRLDPHTMREMTWQQWMLTMFALNYPQPYVHAEMCASDLVMREQADSVRKLARRDLEHRIRLEGGDTDQMALIETPIPRDVITPMYAVTGFLALAPKM
jgi:hypothetical protein